ncbi:hypothetical protein D6D02_03680 [Aureobasidium pullulans]|nr:hypothetical protein D6D02_03680 [Aureobasidium pullulans]
MATNTRDGSLLQQLTTGRMLPLYLGSVESYGESDKNAIYWLDKGTLWSLWERSFSEGGVKCSIKKFRALPGFWKSGGKVSRFVISSEDERPVWFSLAAIIEEVFTEPTHQKPEQYWINEGLRVRVSFDLYVKGAHPDVCLGTFEDPNYPCTFRMTLAPGTWNAKLHQLSQPVKRNGQIKRTEIHREGIPSVSDMTSIGIDQAPEISVTSTQDHGSDHTTRSWLQNPAGHCVNTGKAQRSIQVLVNESSDLNSRATALLITNSASKSGSSTLDIDAIPIGSDERTRGDFDDSDIYCSTELHERLSTESDIHMVSDRLDLANNHTWTTEQTRASTDDSEDTQLTVQPRVTGQPHAKKQADHSTCSKNQTLISEQSRRIAEPSHAYTTLQHLSNNRRVQPPQSDHGDLNSSEHIDLLRAILHIVNNAHSIGHARFLSRRNYDESSILIKRFVGRRSVPMMLLNDDGPKNHLIVMEELRAMKRAIELLTGRW